MKTNFLACAVLCVSTLFAGISSAQDSGVFPSRSGTDPLAPPGQQSCTVDQQCPGELICQANLCSDPKAPAPAAAGGAPVGGACTNDAECAGSAVCNQNACVFPGEAAPAGAGAPAPSAPGGALCNSDGECAGASVCTNHYCQDPGAAAGEDVDPADAGKSEEVLRLEQEREDVSLGGGITLMAVGLGLGVHAFPLGYIFRLDGYYPESNVFYAIGVGGVVVLAGGTALLIAKINKRKAIQRQIDAAQTTTVSSFSITPDAVVAPGLIAAGFRGTF